MGKINIAILGTRGIPNNYGGFEQFAEYLSKGLVNRGHHVTVYNPHFHPYQESEYEGVKIVKQYSPESLIGAAANFIYDYLCLRDALKNDYDIILECGYNPAAIFYYLCPIHKSILITNMDGLEWKRDKWNRFTKKLIKYFEKCGVKKSDFLVSDNLGSLDYYREEYGKESVFIPYGAEEFKRPNYDAIKELSLSRNGYFLLVARLEPENNIEMIIEGYLKSKSNFSLVVVGKLNTSYAKYLESEYKSSGVRFLGGIYNKKRLNNLRYFSSIYFHGHSVGGTNPSVIEAMSCGCFIISHDNIFNRSVLNDNALFFKDTDDISYYIEHLDEYKSRRKNFIKSNFHQINTKYNWKLIVSKYEQFFQRLL